MGLLGGVVGKGFGGAVGTCDYPEESKVLLGTIYGFGVYTGTLYCRISLAGRMFGQRGVEDDLEQSQEVVNVVAATLKNPNAAAVAWAHVYVHPRFRQRGESGQSQEETTITAWRVGETVAPMVGGQWVVGSKSYQIQSVGQLMKEDEESNYCIYECVTTRI